MNAFELATKAALAHEGETQLANKAYLEFIKANFIIPIEKREDDEVRVLFLQENENTLLPVFSSEELLDKWAQEVKDKIQLLRLTGVDLLKGIGESVTVAMNIGSEIYKEFNPAEVERMRSMILKLFK